MQGIGETLRRLRACRGKDQWQVAYAIGISPSMMCRYELGQIKVPPDVMANLIRYYRSKGLATSYCAGCPVQQAAREMQIRELGRVA
ncbi:Uncharacterized [Moorella glycerini]|uniref:Helix-turn-helix protein n=1 Tax=Neomoorella stamsii TaxID=1266720 RepID=A0A9X7J044_9FIRM|nr:MULTISPECIES: helix-turn-helix transcriptional regulator [Moorella]PRR69635.1 hypothetical protein MOST_30570 [Moorella stamsii]CEP67841.1 Uncharacterized [Moorella glycerini]